MKWESFDNLYSSMFRPLGVRDGIEAWQKFAAGIAPADEILLESAMMACGFSMTHKRQNGAEPFAPRIPDLLYFLYKEREKKKVSARSFHTDCSLCGGSGKLLVASVKEFYRNSGKWPVPVEKLPKAHFSGFEICSCPDCSAIYQNASFADALRKAGYPDSTPLYQLAERIGSEVDAEKKPEKSDIRKKSAKADAETKSADTASAKPEGKRELRK